MTGGGDPPPPPFSTSDGDFLLRLLQSQRQQQQHQQQQSPSSSSSLHIDPAVAAVGPSIPFQNPNFFHQTQQGIPPNTPPWLHHHTPAPQQQQQVQSPPQFYSAPHQHFRQQQQQPAPQQSNNVNFDRFRQQQQPAPQSNYSNNLNNDLVFGSLNSSTDKLNVSGRVDYDLFKEREVGFNHGPHSRNGFDSDRRIDPRVNWNHHNHNHASPPEPRRAGPPPGFLGAGSNQRRNLVDSNNVGREISSSSSSGFSGRLSNGKGSETEWRFSSRDNGVGVVGGRVSGQVDHPGLPAGTSAHHSVSGLDVEQSLKALHFGGRVSGQLEKPVGSANRSVVSGLDVDQSLKTLQERLSRHLDQPGLPAGTSVHRSVLGSDVEQSLKVLDSGGDENGVSQDEVDELSEQLVGSVLEEDSTEGKNESGVKKKHPRDKDFRSDARGKWILPQRMRNSKRLIECRRDIHRMTAPFLTIYESLVPPEEEKAKQKQLMTLLEKIVCKEWPNAKLYVYGSCANSFGVSRSDIDVCLAIDDRDVNKADILLKLADLLESDNFQNVQALTRARVPIVKLMDPVTGISCDICINNVLAVVNTKLLRDYAEIDVRLRQLAFLVKHWAKSRGVNETYQGTLSSYAYVLMCIHFLQQRAPPILPCLQRMEATYAVTVDGLECAFFDQVERLRSFGMRNPENIAELMWGFFGYWAYCHDYANTVVSVRTGSILSKHDKDWTRRVGNDRHLICIEDPFETSHDLGRVVDKHSIRVLREEFERAAYIMQYDPNPCVTLFEPYIPV